VTKSELVGTWNAKQSNGVSLRWVFNSDDSFTYGRVLTGGYAPTMDGKFTTGDALRLEGTFRYEDGTASRQRVELTTYVSTQFCDVPFAAPAQRSGVVGTWTSHGSSQDLDSSGNPVGHVKDLASTLVLRADGSARDDVGNDGTYTVAGDTITVTVAQATRSYKLVDDQVLCNPAFAQ
jgi:hypothetical protein